RIAPSALAIFLKRDSGGHPHAPGHGLRPYLPCFAFASSASPRGVESNFRRMGCGPTNPARSSQARPGRLRAEDSSWRNELADPDMAFGTTLMQRFGEFVIERDKELTYWENGLFGQGVPEHGRFVLTEKRSAPIGALLVVDS